MRNNIVGGHTGGDDDHDACLGMATFYFYLTGTRTSMINDRRS